MKKITVLGGGTGSMAVLSGLKQYKDLDISVVVNMTDDGGSNAVVRDEFGLLPLSDLRKSIIALSELNNETIQQMFTYRFDIGKGLSGHTLGNLMMTALSKITGSELEAIEIISKLFHVRGSVIPVTLEHTRLVAKYSDGSEVKSEHLIDDPIDQEKKQITNLRVEPSVQAFPKAIQAIEDADYIIIGPGDLFTTTLANIVIGNMAKTIKNAKGKIIFINNLMTKKGQTDDMTANDLSKKIKEYLHREPDFIILNDGKIPELALQKYINKGEEIIKDDLEYSEKIIRANIIGDEIVSDSGDTLVRSLVRHDKEKLGEILYNIMK
jgi:uncharacterized cofD-like protein